MQASVRWLAWHSEYLLMQSHVHFIPFVYAKSSQEIISALFVKERIFLLLWLVSLLVFGSWRWRRLASHFNPLRPQICHFFLYHRHPFNDKLFCANKSFKTFLVNQWKMEWCPWTNAISLCHICQFSLHWQGFWIHLCFSVSCCNHILSSSFFLLSGFSHCTGPRYKVLKLKSEYFDPSIGWTVLVEYIQTIRSSSAWTL